jgi:hypothetical protein
MSSSVLKSRVRLVHVFGSLQVLLKKTDGQAHVVNSEFKANEARIVRYVCL